MDLSLGIPCPDTDTLPVRPNDLNHEIKLEDFHVKEEGDSLEQVFVDTKSIDMPNIPAQYEFELRHRNTQSNGSNISQDAINLYEADIKEEKGSFRQSRVNEGAVDKPNITAAANQFGTEANEKKANKRHKYGNSHEI
jgi:hypothetical protein